MYVMVREYVWTLKSIVDFNRRASYTVSRDLGTDRSPDSIHDQARALPDQQLFLAERHCWPGVSALSTFEHGPSARLARDHPSGGRCTITPAVSLPILCALPTPSHGPTPKLHSQSDRTTPRRHHRPINQSIDLWKPTTLMQTDRVAARMLRSGSTGSTRVPRARQRSLQLR